MFAVPGDIDRPTSQGCNLLIRDGAIPVLGPDDLIEAVSLILGPPASNARLSEGGDALLDALGPVGRSVDWLATTLGLGVPEVLAQIARWEARGIVARSGSLVLRREVPLPGAIADER